jgi:large subunit ribosomal protein L24
MYGKPGKEKEVHRGRPRIKRGDTVLVTSGKDRGKRGKVLRVDPSKGTAVVERTNLLKRHTRPNPQKNIQGGILDRESPIQMSNLQVICPSCGEATRTGSHRTAEGAKRFCKKCDTEM